MANLTRGLQISPWWIMIVLGYLVLGLVWHFYTKTLPKTYQVLNFKHVGARAFLLIFVTLILFGLYGMSGFSGYGLLSHFISLLLAWMIFPIIVLCWPLKKGVK